MTETAIYATPKTINSDYEYRLQSAIDAIKRSSDDLWEAAEHVWYLAANFVEREGTWVAQIQAATGKEKDHIYDLWHAWQMRRTITEAFPTFLHVLPISHYYTVYDCRNNYKIDFIAEVMDVAAIENRPVRWLAAKLGGQELSDNVFNARLTRLHKQTVNLRSDAELLGKPQEKLDALRDAANRLREAGE